MPYNPREQICAYPNVAKICVRLPIVFISVVSFTTRCQAFHMLIALQASYSRRCALMAALYTYLIQSVINIKTDSRQRFNNKRDKTDTTHKSMQDSFTFSLFNNWCNIGTFQQLILMVVVSQLVQFTFNHFFEPKMNVVPSLVDYALALALQLINRNRNKHFVLTLA